MAIICELRFQGLIAFAAPRALKTAGEAAWLDVLLMDVGRSTLNGMLPPHLPVVEIPNDVLDPNGAPASHHIPGYKRFHSHSRTYRLNGLKLTTDAGGGTGTVVAEHDPATAAPPSGKEWSDVEWVPDLEDIRGNGNGFIDDSFGASRDVSNLPVAAQIELTNGTLRGNSPSDSRYEDVEFQFRAPSELVASQAPQYVTDRTGFLFPVADHLDISLTPIAGGAPYTIRLKSAATEKKRPRRVPIFITNLPPHTTTHAGMLMGGSDLHFAVFYDLIDQAIDPNERRIPEMVDTLGVFGGSDGPFFCPPARAYTKPGV
jgi:hypothetical protein